jgi:exodeoxyribonuclease VII large subunit
MAMRVAQLRGLVEALATRPAFTRPTEGIRLRERRADELSLRLHAGAKTLLRDRQSALATVAGKLETLSPLSVLGRGYSLTYKADGRRLITAAGDVRPGERIITQFGQGTAISVVESVDKQQLGEGRG